MSSSTAVGGPLAPFITGGGKRRERKGEREREREREREEGREEKRNKIKSPCWAQYERTFPDVALLGPRACGLASN